MVTWSGRLAPWALQGAQPIGIWGGAGSDFHQPPLLLSDVTAAVSAGVLRRWDPNLRFRIRVRTIGMVALIFIAILNKFHTLSNVLRSEQGVSIVSIVFNALVERTEEIKEIKTKKGNVENTIIINDDFNIKLMM